MSEETEGLISGKKKKNNILQRLAYTISKKVDEWKWDRMKAKSKKEIQNRIKQSTKFLKQAEKEYDENQYSIYKWDTDKSEERSAAIVAIALGLEKERSDKQMAEREKKSNERIKKEMKKMERTR